MVHDYESMNVLGARQGRITPVLLEAFRGQDIVQWYGNIERQLRRYVEENEGTKNYVYAEKLREFLKVWTANEITGSLSVDTIRVLKTAAEMLAVDAWNLDDYFSNLRDQLRKLQASEEELPRVDMNQNDDARGPGLGGGGSGGGGGMPPMSGDFGPEENPPGDAAAPAGGNPPEGGPEGAPGAEPPAGGPEGAPGAEPAPGAPVGAPGEEEDEDLPKGPIAGASMQK